ncbi:MAG: MFS transporter [Armatimonadetes bacterium]|nr:MFS transporter [Armatimonadota bacterium]
MAEQLTESIVLKPWRGPRGLRAFRHRNFTLYWIGQVISFTGSWMQSVAMGWLVLKLTGSAWHLGVVGAMATIPVLIFGLPAGTLADRLDKRKIVIVTQTLAMIQALVLAALNFSGLIQVWHVMVLAAFAGTVNAFDNPIRQSMIAELVDCDKDDLMNAIALSSAAFNGARIVGPALAGILVVAFGTANCFLLNGISYIAALVALLLITSKSACAGDDGQSMFLQIKQGLAYTGRHGLIRDLLIMTGVASLFGGQLGTMMPLFANGVLHVGAKGYGILMAVGGVGALIGAGVTALAGHRFKQRTIVMVGAFVAGAGLLMFSRCGNYYLAIGFLIMFGFGTMLFFNVSNSMVQAASPDSLRGRVISVRNFVFFGLTPAGALLVGYLAQHYGVQDAVTLGAAACLGSVIYFSLFSKAIRNAE